MREYTKNLYRVGQAAQLLRVSPITIRRYTNEGKLNYTLTPGGHRAFTLEDLAQLKPDLLQLDHKIAVHYTRASDGDQKLIQTQQKLLTENYGQPNYSIIDKASGLNENRPGLKKILKLAKKNKITDLYITEKDRLTRFGYTYLEELLKDRGVTIHVLGETKTKSPQEELIQDFLHLLASFSGKYYRLRGHQQKKDFLKTAEEALP